MRTLLDIWPPFPITITCLEDVWDSAGQDNIIAGLKHHHDRVAKIDFQRQTGSVLEKLVAVMQEPFPALTYLYLSSHGSTSSILPEAFLGGSAPCLRSFILDGIAFSGLPNLVLFASHVVDLRLTNIPIIGYISPEAMATCLVALPNLDDLDIGFQSPRSRPDRMSPPPRTRVVLPALTSFRFSGVCEYLEDLVARIDTPQLNRLEIKFFFDLFFRIPRLQNFIRHAQGLKPLNQAEVEFYAWAVRIVLGSGLPSRRRLELQIRCKEPDWQASSMAQVCSQLLPFLSCAEQLHLHEYTSGQVRSGNGMDLSQWLELFHPFPGVQSLYVFNELRPLVAQALQDLTEERAAQVLPALCSLFFEGPSPSRSIMEDMKAFVAARRHSNYPVDVHWTPQMRGRESSSVQRNGSRLIAPGYPIIREFR